MTNKSIGQRLPKKLPYGSRAECTREFKKASLTMTVLLGAFRRSLTVGPFKRLSKCLVEVLDKLGQLIFKGL